MGIIASIAPSISTRALSVIWREVYPEKRWKILPELKVSLYWSTLAKQFQIFPIFWKMTIAGFMICCGCRPGSYQKSFVAGLDTSNCYTPQRHLMIILQYWCFRSLTSNLPISEFFRKHWLPNEWIWNRGTLGTGLRYSSLFQGTLGTGLRYSSYCFNSRALRGHMLIHVALLQIMLYVEMISAGGLTRGMGFTKSVRHQWVLIAHHFAAIHGEMTELTKLHRVSSE